MFRPLLILILICSQYQIQAQSDTLNQTDNNGLKQGYWIFYGKHFPEKGYCDSCKVEEGNYLDNRKIGIWTFYYKNDTVPKLTGTFVNGRPEGDYKKFYASGKIREEGRYQKGKQIGTYRRYFESGCLAMEKFYNVSGKEEGLYTTYYDFCDLVSDQKGHIEAVYDKIDGMSFSGLRYYPSGCVRQYVLYGIQGEVLQVEYFQDTCSYGIALPDSLVKTYSDQFPLDYTVKKFDPNGLNKVYNNQNLLWMEGDFKAGKLWDGKIYKYTNSGNLYRLELWKDGEFFEVIPVTEWDRNNFEYSMRCAVPIRWNQIDSTDISDPVEWGLERSRHHTPFALGGYMPANKTFDPGGQNFVYSVSRELWLSGKFKDGYLRSGKQYFYDEDGNEIYYEVYRLGMKWRKVKPAKKQYR